jgi:DNA-binding transcriptional regulator YhcF (GntR family)
MDDDPVVPRYKQLINAVITGIEKQEFVRNDRLPSIQDLCMTLGISKNVVEKAYNGLKKSGMVTAIHGKGYFIIQDRSDAPRKVLLLFNKLSFQRKAIYNDFISTAGDQTVVDFYTYNDDFEILRKLLLEKHEEYDKIVIMPHFSARNECSAELFNRIPMEKLVLVDKMPTGLRGRFSAICYKRRTIERFQPENGR